VERMVAILRRAALQPATVALPADADTVLEFDSPLLDACRPSGAGADHSAIDVQAWLVTDGTDGTNLRKLGAAKLVRQPAGTHGLHVRAESALLLHAASLAGQWLLLDASRLRVLAPLPDFTADESRVPAWIEPTHLLSEALGLAPSPTVAIDPALARALMARHSWFSADSCLQWRRAAQGTDLSDADRLSA
jgi:hypothetical protein